MFTSIALVGTLCSFSWPHSLVLWVSVSYQMEFG